MGWRQAFRTAMSNGDGGEIFKAEDSPPLLNSRSPRFGGRLSFFSSSSSNPSTPRLHCLTNSSPAASNRSSERESVTSSEVDKALRSPKSSCFRTDLPSPISPLKLALFRHSFRSRRVCGVCGRSVKSGRATAVYTAQCGHVFHFPCISTHVRGTSGEKLTCIVCNVEWSDEPLLAVHQNLPSQSPCNINNAENEEKRVISTPKAPHRHYQTRPVRNACYDDDEPLSSLRSPRAPKLVFNPSPESRDEGEETSMMMNVRTESNNTNVDIRLMPESALVSKTSDHQTWVMVLKLKAPQLPQTARNSHRAPLLETSRRAPIDLVTVLDVSGSMRGQKMQMMRRAMRLVVSSLCPQDRLSIVAFSAVPKRLCPFTRMTLSGQRVARNIVDRLECSKGSCVSDALRKATKVLEDRRDRNSVATIILLSDGQCDIPKSQRPAAPPVPQPWRHSTTRFAHAEIPIDSPADDTFAKWVGGLLSVVSQDLRIELGFGHGSPPAEITAVYCRDKQKSLLQSNSVALGDLYGDEERELLMELRVPISSVPLEKFLTVKSSFNDPATHERISFKQETFIIPPPCLSPRIQQLRNMFIATRAVAESRQILKHGEFTSAYRLLSSARDLLMGSGSMSADDCVNLVEAEIMELAKQRQAQQIAERERVFTVIQRQQVAEVAPHETPPSSAAKTKSWIRASNLHSSENARF